MKAAVPDRVLADSGDGVSALVSPLWLKIVGVTVLYYAAARLGLLLQLPGTNASPVWPPSGVGLAAVLLFGLGVWPGILLGALLANLATLPYTSGGFIASFGICVGNTLEHVVALLLIRAWIGPELTLDRAVDVFRFVIAATLSCAVASTGGVWSLWVTGIVTGDLAVTAWFTWWLGDTAGMLVVAPALYLWWRDPRPALSKARLYEFGGLLLFSIGTAELVFGGWISHALVDSLQYMVVPGLLWAAFRFGPRETALVALLISVVAVSDTWLLLSGAQDVSSVELRSPFVTSGLTRNDSLLMLQVFVCALAVTAMALAAAVSQRRKAEAAERALRAQMQRRVYARTADLEISNAALKESNLDLHRFAHVVAHDLQTPLRDVASHAEFLRSDFGDVLGVDGGRRIDGIVGGVEQMIRMIQELLEYSHIDAQAAPFESVSMNDAFDEAVRRLSDHIREEYAEVSRDELPFVTGNSRQLTQLIENLVRNGISYHRQARPRVHVTAEPSGTLWKFSVRDNGVGIDAKDHERIFEIFRRLRSDHQYPGTGIGLAICQRIVNRHGGVIGVDSEPGAGSTFWFTVPRA